MEKWIPFEKLSKKKQRELNAMKRGSWHGVNPVTRKPEPSKAYNRRKAQKWSDDSMSVPFMMFAARTADKAAAVQHFTGVSGRAFRKQNDVIY